jgi:hypothetical protein
MTITSNAGILQMKTTKTILRPVHENHCKNIWPNSTKLSAGVPSRLKSYPMNPKTKNFEIEPKISRLGISLIRIKRNQKLFFLHKFFIKNHV